MGIIDITQHTQKRDSGDHCNYSCEVHEYDGHAVEFLIGAHLRPEQSNQSIQWHGSWRTGFAWEHWKTSR